MATQETRKHSSMRRTKYKELLDLGSAIESTAENESAVRTLQRITEVATRSDELNAQGRFQDRIENTTEVVMDAQVMKMTHELLGSIVQTMDNTEVSDDEFVAAINRTIGCNKEWDKLAEIGMRISKTLFYSQPLLGTFDEATVIEPKEKKERRQKTTSKNTEQVKPIAVTQQHKEEEEAKTLNAIMNHIAKLYKTNKNESLPYYKLVIDPTNFMNTIQNAFKISFLFRDGAIAIADLDKYGYPNIRPTQPTDKERHSEDLSYQLVSSLTTTLCDEMIERYRITEPMLYWSDDDE